MKKYIGSLLACCMIAAVPDVTAVHAEETTGETEKNETVYIVTDASGKPDDVVVSEWLKNVKKADVLKDVTSLENIENVSGEETFSQNGEELTWQSGGNDIYYQGTTDEELPVAVNVTYELDGKTVTPEEIKGQSGHVKIRFDYENRTETTVSLNGKQIQTKMPFAVISGMQLPAEHFSEITVTNGKVINDGKNSYVIGMAFPGLIDALALSENDELYKKLEDIDIPESIEVEADAKDFDLSLIMSLATSDISSLYEGNQLDTSFTQDIRKLSDATDQLVSGTKQLKDGSTALKDGSGALLEGTGTLKAGTLSLKDGLFTINNGSLTLKDGTASLSAGAGTLKDGTAQFETGINGAVDGIARLKTGSDSLKDGTSSLKAGAEELSAGSESVNTGAKQLSEGTGALSENSAKLHEGAESLSAGADSMAAGIEKLSGGISQVDNGLARVQSGAGEFSEKLSGGTDKKKKDS